MASSTRNFIRSRFLIDLVRSGQRTIEASIATPYYRELQPGDRVNYRWHKIGDLQLVCEIVEKRHFTSIDAMIADVGLERIVGAGKQPRKGLRRASREEDDRSGILLRGNKLPASAVEEFGVLAFQLKVVEDM